MSDQTFKLNPNDELIITVKRGKSDGDGKTPTRKRRGLIDLFSRDEHLPRRIKKSGGVVNFYILSYLLDPETGFYEDLPFYTAPAIPNDSPFDNYPAAFSLSDAETRDDLFFAVPFNDWKTRFKKLDPTFSENYHINVATGGNDYSLVPSEAKWTNDGFAIEAPVFVINSGYLPVYRSNDIIYFIQLSGDGKNKITATRNYAAATATNFNPSASFDIFLVPNIYLSKGTSAVEVTPGDSSATSEKILNNFYTIFPNDVLINPANEYHNDYVLAAEYSMNGSANEADFINANRMTEFAKSLPGARAFKRILAGSPVAYETAMLSEFPGNEFVYPEVASYGNIPRFTLSFSHAESPAGTLIAVISQNEHWFYVWK